VALLAATRKRPFGVGLAPRPEGPSSTSIRRSRRSTDAEVVPQFVLTKAPDGMEIHNQLLCRRI